MAVDQDLVPSIDALEAVCLAELFRAFREPIRIRIPSILDMACVSVGSIVVATQPRHLAVSHQLRYCGMLNWCGPIVLEHKDFTAPPANCSEAPLRRHVSWQTKGRIDERSQRFGDAQGHPRAGGVDGLDRS